MHVEGGFVEWSLSEALPQIVEQSVDELGVRGHSLAALLMVFAHMAIVFAATDAMFGNVSVDEGSDPWTNMHFGCLLGFHMGLMFNLASYGRAM